MKQKIGILLFSSCIFFTACKKSAVKPSSESTQGVTGKGTGISPQGTSAVNSDTVGNNVTGYMRIQLAKDSINSDNVLVAFNPAAKTIYVSGEDAPTLQGFGAVSLSSLSSNNIPLAINTLPLTKAGLKIALKVNAQASGIYSLNMIAIKNIPSVYRIWLKDNYQKDSLDYRANPTYSFNINTADTTSFGSNRFKLVISEN
jgi:trimeric autotransporter adhesin